jgi:hypothetical protein
VLAVVAAETVFTVDHCDPDIPSDDAASDLGQASQIAGGVAAGFANDAELTINDAVSVGRARAHATHQSQRAMGDGADRKHAERDHRTDGRKADDADRGHADDGSARDPAGCKRGGACIHAGRILGDPVADEGSTLDPW